MAIGVLSLLLFEGFNQGALWQYQERVVHTRMGHFQISKKVSSDVLSTDVSDTLFNNSDSLSVSIRKNPQVKEVFPRLRVSGLLANDKRSLPVIAEGIDPLRENKFFDELDYKSGGPLKPNEPNGIILGDRLAAGLGVKAGSRITLLANTINGSMNAADFEVVGTFQSGVKEFDESFARIHLSEAQSLLQTEGVSSLLVGLHHSEDIEAERADLQTIIPQEFDIQDFKELDDIYYGNSVRWLKAQFLFIRLIIYLVVIMSILNTVTITIHERTAEIGTMRAMGFGRNFVRNQFLREYVLLGLTGGVVGVVLAFGIKFMLFTGIPMPASPGATKGLNVFLRLRCYDVVINSVVAVLCAVIACYFPAKKAASMKITEALGHKI